MAGRASRWLGLAAGLAVIALAVAAIHAVVPRAGGPWGRLWRHNVEHDLKAGALFYTEVGPARHFVDARAGRYAVPAPHR